MSLTFGSHLLYTPKEALEKCLKGSILLDVRPDILTSYKAFEVPEVLYCPWQELEPFIDQIPEDREIIVADSSGIQGREVIELLINRGFMKVAGLAGGMIEWERDGLPLQMDNQARLSGSCMCQLKFRMLKK
jgi:rhodanese-related sulfurtransferase